MSNLLWMPDVLRAAGLTVREVDGWQTRGHGAMGEILGVLLHHTAGPATGSYPSERVVVHGRPGLAGPLAQLGLARDGTWIVIAAGSAWHAGTGSVPWCPRDQGNAHLIGVEAESVGTRDDWTPAQREAYPRGVAALLRHLGLGSYRAIGHKEWAPSRKIDPAFWDMTDFRADVARWMTPSPPVEALPTLVYGQRDPAGLAGPVRRLQEFMVRAFPSYNRYSPTGFYGAATRAGVAEFQRRAGVAGSPLDGTIVGPATNAALARHGYR